MVFTNNIGEQNFMHFLEYPLLNGLHYFLELESKLVPANDFILIIISVKHQCLVN